MLDSLDIKFRKLKILKEVTFLTFDSAESRDAAILKLNGHVWKGKNLDARIALGRADPLLKKRVPSQLEADSVPEKRLCNPEKVSPLSKEDAANRLRDNVTPLWRMPYDPDQLNEKRNFLLSALGSIRSKIVECDGKLERWLPKEGIEEDSTHSKTVCPLEEILKSPLLTKYRNKSEVTIGFDLNGNGPIVGFRFTKYRDGMTAVESFDKISILPDATCAVLESLQKFVCQESNLPQDSRLAVFDPVVQRGHWRQAMVRESRNNDRLLLVDIHPQQLNEDKLNMLADRLREWFSPGGQGEHAKLTSLYLSTRKRSSEAFDSSTTRLLFGKDHIVEKCCGLNFRISLSAFFQVNTLAAELLYQEIGKLANSAAGGHMQAPTLKLDSEDPDNHCNAPSPGGETVLLDVCCGTGTIALCLSKYFDRVIGIELVRSAVEDAKRNAASNGITNAQFFLGKAEDVLRDVIATLPSNSKVVAVVDPPRAGLHPTVIQSLRRCPRLDFVIFVSCNLEAAVNNFVNFARPTSNRTLGDPFIPRLAKAVDLFPQTRHVEAVIFLERLKAEDVPISLNVQTS
ncbi:unnamed protein product [Calicophoron daubneyi]|uniref:tRNA (uracil(54)-C(5))-methyltransferase n=1 Tax=Calicophoron daubneyi TaxID=300641 RepID=A0AAV2TMG4_CALDB